MPFPSITNLEDSSPQGAKKLLRVVALQMLTQDAHLTPFQHANPSVDPRSIDTMCVLSYFSMSEVLPNGSTDLY